VNSSRDWSAYDQRNSGRANTVFTERERSSVPPFDSCSRPKRKASSQLLSSLRSHFQKNEGL
jgi:hypothetical protein